MPFPRSEKLTLKQRLFIVEYFLERNATKAAVKAGYSPRTARSAGSRLLTNVDINRAIENLMAEYVHKIDLSSRDVIQELRKIAFNDAILPGSKKLKALELLGKSFGLFQNSELNNSPDLKLEIPHHGPRRS